MQGNELAKKSPMEKVGDKSLYSAMFQPLIIRWSLLYTHQHKFSALSSMVLICTIDLSAFGCLKGLETIVCSKYWFFSGLEIKNKEG